VIARADRPVDDATIEAATTHYAAPPEEHAVASASCFVFRLGGEWLALPGALLDEVVETRAIHSLPHRRGTTRAGLINVRGSLVVHVSLAGLLGIDADEPRRMVVLADARGRLAISVDEVLGMHFYDPAGLRPVPSTLGRALDSYAAAILDAGGHVVGVLDGDHVLASLSAALA
jgi:chemotaxis-related protein WspD